MKNLADMMKQVGQMQSRMADMQKRLEATTVEGQSGGGLVTVKMTGKAIVSSVTVDPSLIKAEEREILEDLLVAAMNDAKSKVDALTAAEMKNVTGGMPLPPGFNLPF
jgi:nucleoid-associated protein EbfC